MEIVMRTASGIVSHLGTIDTSQTDDFGTPVVDEAEIRERINEMTADWIWNEGDKLCIETEKPEDTNE